jgi:CBS domain-containing protein
VTPETSVRKAAQRMHEYNVHRLLVVDEAGKLIGILTQGDIVRFMASHQDMPE